MAKKLSLVLALSLLAGCNLATDTTQAARDATLLPLAVGRSWVYEIHTTGGAACAATDNQMTSTR